MVRNMKEKSAHERLHKIRELIYSFELDKAQEKRIIDIIEDAVGLRAENTSYTFKPKPLGENEKRCQNCGRVFVVLGPDHLYCRDCPPF